MNRLSRPTRGAWIEIATTTQVRMTMRSRAPHGARGLKSLRFASLSSLTPSRPTRGAWIEMPLPMYGSGESVKSRPTRGAWIEILDKVQRRRYTDRSRPTRGAWIEIVLGRKGET